MATCNGATFLEAQLSSLAKQTRWPDELVISDDASTDDTLTIAAAFAKTAPFPVVLSKNDTRLGFQDNFLKAARLCSGRYVAFCDQDDVWFPEKLSIVYQTLVQKKASLVAHGATITDARLRPITRLVHGAVANRTYARGTFQPLPGNVYGFTLAFDKALLDLIDPALRPDVPDQPGVKLYHDVWVALLASNFGTIVHLERPLAYYRQHANNVLGARRTRRLDRLAEHLDSPVSHYRNRARFAYQCAEAFEVSASNLAVDLALMAHQGAALYRRIATSFGQRADLFEHPQRTRRLATLVTMLASGVYTSRRRGGLGTLSLLKDLLSACSDQRLRLGALETPPHSP
ncbi:hypothetical protein MMA231_04173 (plasmid) [Asticcacaulis sp. MM231]